MVRSVGIAGAGFLLLYAVLSVATGQRVVLLGDLAQLIPPLAYAALTLWLGRRSRGQVSVFWNLNAVYALMWSFGQVVWTYYDVTAGGVPVISPTDPLFFVSSIPLAAALYGRPERDRPRWLFDIVLLDIILIALFSAFIYIYFIVTIAVTDGREDLYNNNLTQLLNARNLLLAVWAAWLWHTAGSPAWRRMLGVYAVGLAVTFAAGIVYDLVDRLGVYIPGALWDLMFMVPYVLMALAAAMAYDAKLFEPEEEAPALSKLPMVSLIAITLLVAIPAIDEISRRLLTVSPATESLRTHVALAMMIPFGIVVVVREFLSRRALIRAGQDLATTRQRLVQREKLAAVGQLVSGVAHELNNPLQGVLGHMELLRATGAFPKQLRKEVQTIYREADRAAKIVRNLLVFAGSRRLTRRSVSLNGVLQKVLALRASAHRAASIEVVRHYDEHLPRVQSDPLLLHQVFLNMVMNAEHAIAATGDAGRLEVTTEVAPSGDRIVAHVRDSGTGIPANTLTRIFEPFYTTKDVGKGTGLGLAIAYGIVQEHGGHISAANHPDGGAIFTVELPTARAAGR
jgi:signal transduction histidine kinase